MTGGAVMKKKIKRGFTLVELIVVMAIFSILLLGAMMITQPVSRMYKNTALSEKTYSLSNNIQVFLQGRLEYAEVIGVGTSNKLDLDTNGAFDKTDLAVWAEDFRQEHFVNTVGYNGTAVVPLKGKIHIIRCVNNADGTFPQGQITERIYDFRADQPISIASDPAEVAQLNDTYFNAADAAYNFSYALGATTLQSVPTPAGGLSGKGETYRALTNDVKNEQAEINQEKLAVSIVIDKKTGGSIDVAGSGNTYRAFTDPLSLQVANLPLTNVMHRKNNNENYGISRPYMDPATSKVDFLAASNQPASAGGSGRSYTDARADKSIDFNNDIYFIFAYTDEIVNS